jgi:hypothetical protein
MAVGSIFYNVVVILYARLRHSHVNMISKTLALMSDAEQEMTVVDGSIKTGRERVSVE